MKIEMECPCCDCRFDVQASGEVFDRLLEEGPELGDGMTLEDTLHAALADEDARCLMCGGAAAVSEDSLGQLALELLWQW